MFIVDKLVRWRIFENQAGRRFVMGFSEALQSAKGPIALDALDATNMRISSGDGAAYQLEGPPAYDALVQYEFETNWSLKDGQCRDVTARVCRELGVPEERIAGYVDGQTPSR